MLEKYEIRSFAFEFLSKARTPPFPFVAPGLVFPDDAFIEETAPDFGDRRMRCGDFMPIIIFPTAKDHSWGLYLTADRLWEDSAALMLKSMEQYGREAARKYVNLGRDDNKLFQAERCPFGSDHAARLALIFKKWRELVINERWVVDGNGITNDGTELNQYRTRGELESFVLDSHCE